MTGDRLRQTTDPNYMHTLGAACFWFAICEWNVVYRGARSTVRISGHIRQRRTHLRRPNSELIHTKKLPEWGWGKPYDVALRSRKSLRALV